LNPTPRDITRIALFFRPKLRNKLGDEKFGEE